MKKFLSVSVSVSVCLILILTSMGAFAQTFNFNFNMASNMTPAEIAETTLLIRSNSMVLLSAPPTNVPVAVAPAPPAVVVIPPPALLTSSVPVSATSATQQVSSSVVNNATAVVTNLAPGTVIINNYYGSGGAADSMGNRIQSPPMQPAVSGVSGSVAPMGVPAGQMLGNQSVVNGNVYDQAGSLIAVNTAVDFRACFGNGCTYYQDNLGSSWASISWQGRICWVQFQCPVTWYSCGYLRPGGAYPSWLRSVGRVSAAGYYGSGAYCSSGGIGGGIGRTALAGGQVNCLPAARQCYPARQCYTPAATCRPSCQPASSYCRPTPCPTSRPCPTSSYRNYAGGGGSHFAGGGHSGGGRHS